MVESSLINGHDLVVRLQQLGVDRSLDRGRHEVVKIDVFLIGLAYFEHQAPVGAGARFRRKRQGRIGFLYCWQRRVSRRSVVRRIV